MPTSPLWRNAGTLARDAAADPVVRQAGAGTKVAGRRWGRANRHSRPESRCGAGIGGPGRFAVSGRGAIRPAGPAAGGAGSGGGVAQRPAVLIRRGRATRAGDARRSPRDGRAGPRVCDRAHLVVSWRIPQIGHGIASGPPRSAKKGHGEHVSSRQNWSGRHVSGGWPSACDLRRRGISLRLLSTPKVRPGMNARGHYWTVEVDDGGAGPAV